MWRYKPFQGAEVARPAAPLRLHYTTPSRLGIVPPADPAHVAAREIFCGPCFSHAFQEFRSQRAPRVTRNFATTSFIPRPSVGPDTEFSYTLAPFCKYTSRRKKSDVTKYTIISISPTLDAYTPLILASSPSLVRGLLEDTLGAGELTFRCAVITFWRGRSGV